MIWALGPALVSVLCQRAYALLPEIPQGGIFESHNTLHSCIRWVPSRFLLFWGFISMCAEEPHPWDPLSLLFKATCFSGLFWSSCLFLSFWSFFTPICSQPTGFISSFHSGLCVSNCTIFSCYSQSPSIWWPRRVRWKTSGEDAGGGLSPSYWRLPQTCTPEKQHGPKVPDPQQPHSHVLPWSWCMGTRGTVLNPERGERGFLTSAMSSFISIPTCPQCLSLIGSGPLSREP